MNALRRVSRYATRYLPVVLVFVLLALLLSGCETDTPQNTFDARGHVAEEQRRIFYIAMWPAIVIMIFVLAGIVITVLRFRERDPNQPPPKQTHGNTKLEIAWTIAPAALMLALGVPMVQSIYDLGREPSEDAYVIDVIGQRYSWEFQYPEELDADGFPLSTFNEAHIPVGREVNFRLRSIDVIHSFWVPKLGGKRDVMPCNLRLPEDFQPGDPPADPMADPECAGGQVNKLWLIADEPGTYSGQCAEYCGLQHALMRMTIHADEEADFEAWVDEMLAGDSAGSDSSEQASPTATPAGSGGS